MKNRLPVYIENLELPGKEDEELEERNNSYGYVSFMYLLSLIISLGSVIMVIVLGGK